jgi:hypothetical protein
MTQNKLQEAIKQATEIQTLCQKADTPKEQAIGIKNNKILALLRQVAEADVCKDQQIISLKAEIQKSKAQIIDDQQQITDLMGMDSQAAKVLEIAIEIMGSCSRCWPIYKREVEPIEQAASVRPKETYTDKLQKYVNDYGNVPGKVPDQPKSEEVNEQEAKGGEMRMNGKDDFYVIVRMLQHEPDTGSWIPMSEKCRRYTTKQRAYKLYEKLKMPRVQNDHKN